MNICPDCKHYKIGFVADITSSCLKGNQQVFDKFWLDCANKTLDDLKGVRIECFEPTEFAVMTQDLIDKTHELLRSVKNS